MATPADVALEDKKEVAVKSFYHYKYDLMLPDDLDKKREMSQYLLSIPPDDWKRIAGCFVVFYLFLVWIFSMTILFNVSVDSTQALWTYFAMMVCAGVGIVVAVNKGAYDREQEEAAEAEAEKTTMEVGQA